MPPGGGASCLGGGLATRALRLRAPPRHARCFLALLRAPLLRGGLRGGAARPASARPAAEMACETAAGRTYGRGGSSSPSSSALSNPAPRRHPHSLPPELPPAVLGRIRALRPRWGRPARRPACGGAVCVGATGSGGGLRARGGADRRLWRLLLAVFLGSLDPGTSPSSPLPPSLPSSLWRWLAGSAPSRTGPRRRRRPWRPPPAGRGDGGWPPVSRHLVALIPIATSGCSTT